MHCLQAQLLAAKDEACAVRRACMCQLCVLAQAIYDAKQRTELDMARREQEIKQLQGARAWRSYFRHTFLSSAVSVMRNRFVC